MGSQGNVEFEDPAPNHVMWPEQGSGFEASTFSPAGRAQLASTFVRNARGTPLRRLLLPLVIVPLGAGVIVGGVAAVSALVRAVL